MTDCVEIELQVLKVCETEDEEYIVSLSGHGPVMSGHGERDHPTFRMPRQQDYCVHHQASWFSI